MKTNKIILLITLISVLPFLASGQAVSKRISHTTVGLFNNTNKKLDFQMGLSEQEFNTFQISPQENWISQTFPTGSKPLFMIKTQDKESKYSLKLNTNYMIYWNNEKKKYVLSKVKTN